MKKRQAEGREQTAGEQEGSNRHSKGETTGGTRRHMKRRRRRHAYTRGEKMGKERQKPANQEEQGKDNEQNPTGKAVFIAQGGQAVYWGTV